jgi:hypothetical protein
MATFRKIHISFWDDPYIQSLTPEQRYFFLYLLTNGKTRQCGIYEIGLKKISQDTGYNTDTVYILIENFQNDGKLRYNSATNEIAIKNWHRYNGSESPKVQSLVNEEMLSIKDRTLIEYIYTIDTKSTIRREEEEEKKKKEKKKENVSDEKLNFFNLPEFEPIWESWVAYKKEVHKDRYKTFKSAQTALDRLFRLSGNNAEVAREMIREAMELQWKGFFELKNKFNNGNNKGNFTKKPIPTGQVAKGGFGSLHAH